MSKFFKKTFFLFILFFFLSFQTSITQIHVPPSELKQDLNSKDASRDLKEKNPEVNAEMLQFTAGGHILGFREGEVLIASGNHALKIEFINARPISPANKGIFSGKGNNRQAAKPLEKIVYRNIWEGVTLVYEKHSSGVVKSTYTVKPAGTGSSNPADRIRLRYNVPAEVDENGNLILSFETGRMQESRPVAWQEIKGEYIPVEVSFRFLGGGDVGFKLGSYDPKFPLVIDPVLVWHTFMGSDYVDQGYAIAVDGSGNVYVAGQSHTTWGAPVNPFTGIPGVSDAFAAKLNSNGLLQWNTFMGSASYDYGYGIAVDMDGNVYVAGGSEASWGSPVQFHDGTWDAFAAKLDSNGVRQWHTFIGYPSKPGYDEGFAIAVDTSGYVYLAGTSTFSGYNKAFAAKLNSSNGSRLWCAHMGSAQFDQGYAIALDGSGNVYVAGSSETTWGVPVNPHSGGFDAFVAKLNSSGVLQWHTFMGSNTGYDQGYAIALDGSGYIYVAGHSDKTWGTPVNPYAGGQDAFVAKLNNSGVRQWHTFMGSAAGADQGRAIALDGSGNIYVTGHSDKTWGTPVNPYAGNDDVFLARLSNSGGRQWHTFMGSATGADQGRAIAIDGNGIIHVSGYGRGSWGLPLNPYAGDYDAFVTKLSPNEDLLGSWPSGVWYRNSETSSWVLLSTPADLVAAGDLDSDGTNDLIGVWSSGLWVKYSFTHTWAWLTAVIPSDIASGDMNGDGRDDILGVWPSGIWYKGFVGGGWVKMSSPAQMITTGDLDNDGTDDLIGVWSNGLWVKYSSTNSWLLITSVLPTDIASGDFNGNGRDDILGVWTSGVWYKDFTGGGWVKMSTPANLVTAGDIDGDGTDDLIGTWSSGLWLKNSSTGTWKKITWSLPYHIDAGLFRTGWGAWAISYDAPIVGVYADGPGNIEDYEVRTGEGPGGWNFIYEEEENLKPHEIEAQRIMRTPGPGEPGFRGIEQKNLVPREDNRSRREKIK